MNTMSIRGDAEGGADTSTVPKLLSFQLAGAVTKFRNHPGCKDIA